MANHGWIRVRVNGQHWPSVRSAWLALGLGPGRKQFRLELQREGGRKWHQRADGQRFLFEVA